MTGVRRSVQTGNVDVTMSDGEMRGIVACIDEALTAAAAGLATSVFVARPDLKAASLRVRARMEAGIKLLEESKRR